MSNNDQEFWSKYEQARDKWFKGEFKEKLAAAVQLYRSGKATMWQLTNKKGYIQEVALACMLELEYQKREELGQWDNRPKRIATNQYAWKFEDGLWYPKHWDYLVCPQCGMRTYERHWIDDRYFEICDHCRVRWSEDSWTPLKVYQPKENTDRTEILSYTLANEIYAKNNITVNLSAEWFIQRQLDAFEQRKSHQILMDKTFGDETSQLNI